MTELEKFIAGLEILRAYDTPEYPLFVGGNCDTPYVGGLGTIDAYATRLTAEDAEKLSALGWELDYASTTTWRFNG